MTATHYHGFGADALSASMKASGDADAGGMQVDRGESLKRNLLLYVIQTQSNMFILL